MNTKLMRVASLVVAVGALSGLTGALAGSASGDTTEVIYDFDEQPSLTIEDSAITPSVSVRTSFPFVEVTLTLENNLVRGAFACADPDPDPATPPACPQFNPDGSVSMTADTNGVATFTFLAITEPQPDYHLRAESVRPEVGGPLFATSDKFTIADSTETCNPSQTTCSDTATSPSTFQKVTVVAEAPDEPNQPRWTEDASVGIAFYDYVTVFPTGAPAGCRVSATRTVAPADTHGYFVDVEDDRNVVPTKTVTTTLDKVIVKPDPNNGVTHIEVCLGARNEVAPTTTFPAETAGGSALYDARTDRFWGVLPDCTVPAPVDPCVKSRRKNEANAVITHVVPSPWDEYTHVG